MTKQTNQFSDKTDTDLTLCEQLKDIYNKT